MSSRDVPVVGDVTTERLDAEFDAEREVKGDCSGGCDGLRMPSKLQCLFFCEVVVACRLLGGLSTTVSTGTGFVLWNPNEHPIPVEPRRIEMRNLACSQPQSTRNQTDETRLEIPRTGQFRARFQKQLELSVGQHVLVGMPSRQCLSMPLRPL
jgi:hypothetical protein